MAKESPRKRKPQPAAAAATPNDDAPLDPADDWHVSEDPALDGDFQALRRRTPEDEALARELESLVAKPGDDPYELNWPDEEVDARTAARAEKARQREANKAPRLLAAAAAGIGTTILFIVPIALVAGAPAFALAAAFPITVVGLLLGLPTLLLIERVTKNVPGGITEIALLIVGGAIGYGLTYVLATYLSAGQESLPTIRTVTSLFMMTATAAGFVVAHISAERFRRSPRAVWITAVLIGLSAIMGAVISFSSPGA
jgi:hypothetical protein